MKRADVGDQMELLSTDDGSGNDVQQWIAKVGHEMISNEKIDDVWHIVVKKVK